MSFYGRLQEVQRALPLDNVRRQKYVAGDGQRRLCAGSDYTGFSGHSYTQRDREYCMSPSRTAQYKATIAKLKAEYRGKVDILCGIEWDVLSEDKPENYDYWIGAAHHLYGKNTAGITRSTSARRTCTTASSMTSTATRWPQYEGLLCRGGKGGGQRPGHPGPHRPHQEAERRGRVLRRGVSPLQAAALKALAVAKEHDCRLEVNTGGVYRGYRKDFYPGAWLLGEWQKMGGRVIITPMPTTRPA